MDVTGKAAEGREVTLDDALRYLEDLGWESLYRHRISPGAGSGAPSSVLTADAPPRAPNAHVAAEVVVSGAVAGTATALERSELLAQVAAEASACERCELARGRTHVVFGSGDPDADLMMIGEGPGAREDREGLPFVGPAGELLTKILLAIERTRDQVYIANIVKCRPPRNRDPRPDEVAACRSYLERQIALVRPRVIVALGRIAAQTLLGNDYPVGRLRGTWWEVAGVPVRVTYHPAALLRDSALKRPAWEDMKIVRDRLAEAAPA